MPHSVPAQADRAGGAAGNTWRRLMGWTAAAAALLVILPAGHAAIVASTRISPPHVKVPPEVAGRSWTRIRGGLREVYLQGSPEEIGAAEVRLLRDGMIAVEARLWSDYERVVPWWIARVGIEDLSRVKYRNVESGIPEGRRRELAAQSLGFEPDPFRMRMPTYHRLVFLHAVYDIALSFEHSPLIGCSTFALGPRMTKSGHALLARAFDMETDDVLDAEKAVFLVREDGAIPFASVAWPGFVGAVTGMNAEGVFIVVHGGRAGQPRAEGMPVVFSLREVLEHAHDTGEAIAILRAQEVMVSHIVFVGDGTGRFAVVERAPGVPAYARETRDTALVTNSFEGPLAADPKNQRVLASTTSVVRAQRIEHLLAGVAPGSGTPRGVLDLLRDHGCQGDEGCALGDRRSIDALIATHGVVADATDRVLWVAAGPHLSGKFVGLDLKALLARDHDPSTDGEPDFLPQDPVLEDGRYENAKRHGGVGKMQ